MTLGFGEVLTIYAIRNLENITDGTRAIQPDSAVVVTRTDCARRRRMAAYPTCTSSPGRSSGARRPAAAETWSGPARPGVGGLARGRAGRDLHGARTPARLKLCRDRPRPGIGGHGRVACTPFTSAAPPGRTRTTSTASMITLCCLILGGWAAVRGCSGVFLLIGFDNHPVVPCSTPGFSGRAST